MARIETDPNYTTPTFSRATAAADPFKKEDVQQVAAALSTHDHTNGKGLPLTAGSIPNGTITSAMIADGTIVAADIADGAITSAKILDGTIATADHADASVTNAKLASDTARANLLTNGGFEIWQRGNGPFTANGAFSADRWRANLSGSDTLSVSMTTANTDVGSVRAAQCVCVKSGGTNTVLYNECYTATDGFQVNARSVSASLRVRTSTANAVALRLSLPGTGGTVVQSSYHSGGGGWETLTATGPAPPDAAKVEVQVFFNASCTAYIDNAMLVVGSVPADYAPLHPADDLARCLRYYETYTRGSGVGLVSGGFSYATTGTTWVMPFKVMKAVTPTVTYSAPSTFQVQNGGGSVTATAISSSGIGTDGHQISTTVAGGLTVGQSTLLNALGTGGAMYFEANP